MESESKTVIIESEEKQTPSEKQKWTKWQIIGLTVFILFMLAMLFVPQHVAGVFDAMAQKCLDIVVKNWVIGMTGVATIVAVMIGRILERLGMTDALIRIFSPIAKLLDINPTFLIPGVYNFLGDVNAAGRISAPILKKAEATKDEIKIAVCTMIQFPPTFASFLLGISCLAAAEINAFVVLIFSVLLPLLIVPLILRFTIYRDCKYKDVSDIPSFTPEKGAMETIFGGAIEGAEVLFLTIIPIACAMFSIIATLEYFNIWPYIEQALFYLCKLCNIEPASGTMSMIVAATVGFPMLKEMILSGSVGAGMVVATFMLGTSSFPITIPLSNVPIIWNKATGIPQFELLRCCVLGLLLRFISCAIVGYLIAPLIFV